MLNKYSNQVGLAAMTGQVSQESCAARESALSIITRRAERAERTAAGYRYLQKVMELSPPTPEAESALWEIVCNTREY